MFKRLILSLLIVASCYAAAADTPASAPQPVYIVLYSRFYDHSHRYPNNERLQRLIPLLEKLRTRYPNSGISGLFEFSGSMSQVLQEQNPVMHLVDKVKEASQKGVVDVGYTGEDEPSYLYRPKADLIPAKTPEERWAAQALAAEHFLTDYKNPVTGHPVPGLSGGLQRMQEVFGEAEFIRGLTEPLGGGDSATTHEVRKLNTKAVMMGIPYPDVKRGIEGAGFSAEHFSRFMSPVSETSPEVYWGDNVLHISATSLPDNRAHSTDDPLDIIKQAFLKLNRSRVRVIMLELGSYNRYLTKRKDGSVLYDPMEWLYYHPDNPQFPETMKPFLAQRDVEAGYRNEESVLNWLLEEYLPANPGSRFMSVHDLKQLAVDAPRQVDWEQIRKLSSLYDVRFREVPTQLTNFLQADDRYFSMAETFALMAEALSADKIGAAPVPMRIVYGPITTPNDMGPIKGSVTVRDVIAAASRIAPALRNSEWKPIPQNAIPAYVQVGSVRVNASQFLRLMIWACEDPSPDKVLTLSPITMHSTAVFMYPKNTPMTDQGVGWTYKPAKLRVAATGASPADN